MLSLADEASSSQGRCNPTRPTSKLSKQQVIAQSQVILDVLREQLGLCSSDLDQTLLRSPNFNYYEKLGLYHIHNVALGTPRALGQASTAAVAAHHARLQHCMRWLCSTVESLAARDFGWSNRVSELLEALHLATEQAGQYGPVWLPAGDKFDEAKLSLSSLGDMLVELEELGLIIRHKGMYCASAVRWPALEEEMLWAQQGGSDGEGEESEDDDDEGEAMAYEDALDAADAEYPARQAAAAAAGRGHSRRSAPPEEAGSEAGAGEGGMAGIPWSRSSSASGGSYRVSPTARLSSSAASQGSGIRAEEEEEGQEEEDGEVLAAEAAGREAARAGDLYASIAADAALYEARQRAQERQQELQRQKQLVKQLAAQRRQQQVQEERQQPQGHEQKVIMHTEQQPKQRQAQERSDQQQQQRLAEQLAAQRKQQLERQKQLAQQLANERQQQWKQSRQQQLQQQQQLSPQRAAKPADERNPKPLQRTQQRHQEQRDQNPGLAHPTPALQTQVIHEPSQDQQPHQQQEPQSPQAPPPPVLQQQEQQQKSQEAAGPGAGAGGDKDVEPPPGWVPVFGEQPLSQEQADWQGAERGLCRGGAWEAWAGAQQQWACDVARRALVEQALAVRLQLEAVVDRRGCCYAGRASFTDRVRMNPELSLYHKMVMVRMYPLLSRHLHHHLEDSGWHGQAAAGQQRDLAVELRQVQHAGAWLDKHVMHLVDGSCPGGPGSLAASQRLSEGCTVVLRLLARLRGACTRSALALQLMAEEGVWRGEAGGAPRLLDRCLQQLTADRLAVMVMQQASGRQGGVEAVVTLHRRVSIERVARCDAETARLLRTTLAAAHGPPGRLGLGVMRGRGG